MKHTRISASGDSFIYASQLAAAIELRFKFEKPDDVRVHTMPDTGPHWFFVSIRAQKSVVERIKYFAEGFQAGTRARLS